MASIKDAGVEESSWPMASIMANFVASDINLVNHLIVLDADSDRNGVLEHNAVSLCLDFEFLLSLSPGILQAFGKITEAATTGPANGPRPFIHSAMSPIPRA